jgi:hypothetical protein
VRGCAPEAGHSGSHVRRLKLRCNGGLETPAGRYVVIWPDNDEPGHKYAEAVADTVAALGCRVHTIEIGLLGLGPREDACEWLNAHPDATSREILLLPNCLWCKS